MRKLFKFLMWFLAVLLILVVAIYLTAGIWLKTVVSTVLPQMTKTPVTLEKADISLLSGKITLNGFKIANPNGFTNPNAFELKEIHVNFEPKSILSNKIIINEIRIDGTKIAAEVNKTGNMNLMVLNDNIQQYLGTGLPTTQIKTEESVKAMEKSAQKNNSGKAAIVKDLQIKNSSLNFALIGHGLKVNLPNVHEKNIGQEKKTTLKDIFAGIFEEFRYRNGHSLSAFSA